MELRHIEEATIEKAIVHVLDKNADEPILTETTLELSPTTAAFLTQHILKCLSSEKNKKVVLFNPSGAVYGGLIRLYKNSDDFIQVSQDIAKRLFACMAEDHMIPSGDVIFCRFLSGGNRFYAIMKMDYQTSFLHDIAYKEEGFSVKLISQDIGLPNSNQTLSQAAFFKNPGQGDYDGVILDNPIRGEDGQPLEYFQKKFIQGQQVADHRDKTRFVQNTMEKWVRNHIKDDMAKAIDIRATLEDAFVNGGTVEPQKLTQAIIDNEEQRGKMDEKLLAAGVDTQDSFSIDKKWVAKKYKTKAIRTNTGFTIRGPFETFHDKSKIEIRYNGDGTVDYIIKQVRNISER